MATHTKLAEAIKEIGTSLPMDMEVWFGRDVGEARVKMEIIEPNGKITNYMFLKSDPLPAKPVVILFREQHLETALRDLLATIELHTDCMTGQIDREALDTYIAEAEALLLNTWPAPIDPAESVTRQPAAISYPVGSLGEPVEDQEWLG